MPENMMCSSQKANSREFEENWDRVFPPVLTIMGKPVIFIDHFDSDLHGELVFGSPLIPTLPDED